MNRTTLIAAFLATASIPAAAATSSNIVQEIAPYVFPANRAASANLIYMPDGESYIAANENNTAIIKYETSSGKEIETIFDATHTRESKINSFEGFSVSPDGSKLLIYNNSESIYRRSFRANYYVFDIKRNILKPLSKTGHKQQAPLFAPDNRTVAFVLDNNVQLRKLDYDTEISVTDDGESGKIINGVPDWTYEEEFDTNCSMAWSPDSQTLCFLRYDETNVPLYNLTQYEGACDPKSQYALYPGTFSYKYPVAGEQNSSVSLRSYDVSTRKVKDINIADTKIEYIPRIIFADNDRLMTVTLNREQTRMEIYAVNPRSTTSRSLLVEQSKAWLRPETYEAITLTDKSFIISSARSGYSHLYEYSFEGALLKQWTSGDYDVTACYGKDATGNLYIQSAKSSPLNRVVSKIDIKGRTTDLTPSDQYGSATFSPLKNYYITCVSDAQTPPVYQLKSANGKSVRTLEDNAQYAASFAGIAKKQFLTINSDGYQLNAYIILPNNFDASRRYPVIMDQYSGPGSQSVLNKWQMDWQYYAVNQGYIVFCVDGRGTGGRGKEFEDLVYRRLGQYETIDQLNGARYLQSLPYVDTNRIAICGWSYGGYETLMAVTDSNFHPFKAAVAIAAVTDWRLYDTVYTERYMLTPQANESGYDAASAIDRANNLDCNLLLMYGTNDDNVHPANTLEFVSKLQSEGKLCDMLLFPNMNHSIYGCNSRAVVYGKMLDYFNRNLSE